jgi:hypothetical protein
MRERVSIRRSPRVDDAPRTNPSISGGADMTIHELQGRAHAATVISLARARCVARGERGQGTVEYVGLILLIAVLIAGVVSASRSFKDTGIAEAVVKKIKGAIDGVAQGK